MRAVPGRVPCCLLSACQWPICAALSNVQWKGPAGVNPGSAISTNVTKQRANRRYWSYQLAVGPARFWKPPSSPLPPPPFFFFCVCGGAGGGRWRDKNSSTAQLINQCLVSAPPHNYIGWQGVKHQVTCVLPWPPPPPSPQTHSSLHVAAILLPNDCHPHPITAAVRRWRRRGVVTWPWPLPPRGRYPPS